MATIVDLPISVGTNAENFPVSNPGWSPNDIAGFGNIHLRVTNNGGINTAYNGTDGGHSYLYTRNETPATKTQTVTLRIRRRTDAAGTYWVAVARYVAGNWIQASFSGDPNKPIVLTKRVADVNTTLGTSNDGTRLPADGDEGDLTLEVVGESLPFTARVLWNGVEVIAPVSISDASLNVVGKVGMAQRSFNFDPQTGHYHLRRFTALDGTGGGGGSKLPLKLQLLTGA